MHATLNMARCAIPTHPVTSPELRFITDYTVTVIKNDDTYTVLYVQMQLHTVPPGAESPSQFKLLCDWTLFAGIIPHLRSPIVCILTTMSTCRNLEPLQMYGHLIYLDTLYGISCSNGAHWKYCRGAKSLRETPSPQVSPG